MIYSRKNVLNRNKSLRKTRAGRKNVSTHNRLIKKTGGAVDQHLTDIKTLEDAHNAVNDQIKNINHQIGYVIYNEEEEIKKTSNDIFFKKLDLHKKHREASTKLNEALNKQKSFFSFTLSKEKKTELNNQIIQLNTEIGQLNTEITEAQTQSNQIDEQKRIKFNNLDLKKKELEQQLTQLLQDRNILWQSITGLCKKYNINTNRLCKYIF